jgi:hypothetical protein
MLNVLRQSDIDAVIAACDPEGAADTDDREDISGGLPSPERERVYAIVEHFSREAQEELLALMWTGGPKNCGTFEENLDLARKARDENHASHIAEQHAKLPLYLRDGLKTLSRGS